ncbi:MAG: J domain-containing protein [Candidatus Gastranaerophilaceae bacterium]
MNKYQKLLELNDGFTLDDLKRSYKRQVKRNHPDLFKTEKEKIKANRKMQKLNEAYQVLLEQLRNAEISLATADSNQSQNLSENVDCEPKHEETFEPDEADWLESLLASKCSYVLLGIVITIISVLLSLE